jgi:hypothetical protein
VADRVSSGRPRVDPRCDLVISRLVGIAASYGDATEVPRHCYGAGQQVVLGLFLALVVWTDHTPRRGSGALFGIVSPG